ARPRPRPRAATGPGCSPRRRTGPSGRACPARPARRRGCGDRDVAASGAAWGKACVLLAGCSVEGGRGRWSRPRGWPPGRRSAGPAARVRPSLGDGEALVLAVRHGRVLPRGQAVGEGRAGDVRLADRVVEDRVRVDLERQVGPALGDVRGPLGEHLVDLLAAEVLELLLREVVRLE